MDILGAVGAPGKGSYKQQSISGPQLKTWTALERRFAVGIQFSTTCNPVCNVNTTTTAAAAIMGLHITTWVIK